jgi:hypothetical protein
VIDAMISVRESIKSQGLECPNGLDANEDLKAAITQYVFDGVSDDE